MKSFTKIFLLLLLIFSTELSSGQGFNLEFNRAIFQKLSTYGMGTGMLDPTPQVTIPITVPSGKLWKIEAKSGNFKIDTISINDDYFPGLPLWLPAGTYSLNMVCAKASLTTFLGGYITGVEYNLVP